MKLSAGPVLYYWSEHKLREFYQQMANLPVDIVYLGETVCPKRREILPEQWVELGRQLAASGKEVVLSTLTLLECRADLAQVKKMVDNGEFLVEANDMAGVQLLIDHKLPIITGPAVNIYNHETLQLLHCKGLVRWVMPVELGRDSLASIVRRADLGDAVQTEVFASGRIPLAYSARCYTARAYNLPKDNCQLKCLEHPGGMVMENQQDQELFVLNGIQTMSGYEYNLIHELDTMRRIGVDVVRISPEPEGFAQRVEALRRALDGEPPAAQALLASDQCDGYWFGRPGMERCHAQQEVSAC
ncbi:MAG: U32 family peptidase [Halioglobus sp.]|nr:U32 family peptidase [Halioglobus sp.]